MEVVYVTGEDWQGLYINGNLSDEGHELSTLDILKQISHEYLFASNERIYIEFYDVDQDWLEDTGSFTTTFESVPKDKIHFREEVVL